MQKILRNVFQPSTLKAAAVVASAFGVTVPEPMISGSSTAFIALWGLWETLTDGTKVNKV